MESDREKKQTLSDDDGLQRQARSKDNPFEVGNCAAVAGVVSLGRRTFAFSCPVFPGPILTAGVVSKACLLYQSSESDDFLVVRGVDV